MKVKRYLTRINKADGLFDVPRWDWQEEAILHSFGAEGSASCGQWLGLPEKARHGETWILTIDAKPARKRRVKKS